MTYRKILAPGGKKHLTESVDSASTLCGSTITRLDQWKTIAALEGDECVRCAERTFWAPGKVSNRNSVPVRN